jgi:N-acetylglucosamine malate deacetylase 1
MDVLIFAPHPDDDLIGCGGSMIRLRSEGHHLTVVYMTSGEAGSLVYAREALAKLREEEARQAADLVGAGELIFLRKTDGGLSYEETTLTELVRLIRRHQPGLVYMPHRRDSHKDHRVTHELVAEALRRASGPWFPGCGNQPWHVDTVLSYEVWTPLQDITYTEDITAFISLKGEAIRKHQSQIRDVAYDEAALSLNRYRGVTTGKGRYCECFAVLSVGKI